MKNKKMELIEDRYCANCGDMIPGGKRFFVEIGNETCNRFGKLSVSRGREYVLCRVCAQDLITKLNTTSWRYARDRERAISSDIDS